MKVAALLFVLFALLALTVSATTLKRGITYDADDDSSFALIEESVELDAEKADAAAAAEAESEAEADPAAPAAATGADAPAAADAGTTNAPVLKTVTIITPPEAGAHKKKKADSGKYDHKPLLDNGKQFLKKEYVPRMKKDPCGGPCDVLADPKHHAKQIKKKVLPVQPELRRRTTKADRKYWAEQAKKKAAAGISDRHMKPEFYPKPQLKGKKNKKKQPVTKRLPNIPEFYPKRKPKRIVPLPKCGSCLKCSVVKCAADAPATDKNEPAVAAVAPGPVGTGVATVAAGTIKA